MLFVANPRLFAAGKYIPLVGKVEPEGINEAEVELPVTLKLVDPGSVVLPIHTPPVEVIRIRSM